MTSTQPSDKDFWNKAYVAMFCAGAIFGGTLADATHESMITTGLMYAAIGLAGVFGLRIVWIVAVLFWSMLTGSDLICKVDGGSLETMAKIVGADTKENNPQLGFLSDDIGFDDNHARGVGIYSFVDDEHYPHFSDLTIG